MWRELSPYCNKIHRYLRSSYYSLFIARSLVLRYTIATCAAEKENNREKQLLLAGMVGSARELFEETGIDVRSQLERISPANLRTEAKFYKEGTTLLANEDKHRLFYVLTVTDQDFANAAGVGAMGTDTADCKYKHIKVCRSTFQKPILE